MKTLKQIVMVALITTLLIPNKAKATSFILADFTYTVNNLANVAIATSALGELQFGYFATGFTPTLANYSQWTDPVNFTGVSGYYDGSGPEWSAGINIGNNLLYPVNKQLVAIVYNIADNASLATATQAAILTNPQWKILTSDGSDPTQHTFDLNGKYFPEGLAAAGATTALFGTIDSRSSIVTLDLVPEPSTGALMMIGAAGLVALRRLRKV